MQLYIELNICRTNIVGHQKSDLYIDYLCLNKYIYISILGSISVSIYTILNNIYEYIIR